MKYYQTDGTTEGFLTGVFDAYTDREAFLTSQRVVQPAFGDELVFVHTDSEKAQRVKEKLRSVNPGILHDLWQERKHSADDKDQVALSYIRKTLVAKRPINTMLADPDVFRFFSLIRQVAVEADHLRGFLRFTENEAGVLYAPFESDHDVLDLLYPHFKARLGSIPFLIHDKKRNKLLICNGKEHTVAIVSEDAEFTPSQEEAHWQALWKSYYRHVNIAIRPHEKQMRGYMPVRYWKYLPEKEPF